MLCIMCRQLVWLGPFSWGHSRLCAASLGWSARKVHLRSKLEERGFAGSLEESESRAILPSLRSPKPDPVLERHVVDSRDQGFIFFVALPVAGKVPQVSARGEDHIDPGNGSNLFGILDADRRLNHDYHHHVVIGGLAIVGPVKRAVLAVALAAPAFGRIFGPLHRRLSLLHCVDCGNNNSQSAEVRRLLDVALRRVRHANEGHRRGSPAGPNHSSYVLEREGAVLHLDPQEIVPGVRHGAVHIGVWREDGGAKYLLALFQFLLGGVVNPGG